MTDYMANKQMAMSLSGLRMGPLDPKSKEPRVGTNVQFQIEDKQEHRVPKFLNKERSGFSGGFKIPEEHRKVKMGRKIVHTMEGEMEDHEEDTKNDITKDEIMAQIGGTDNVKLSDLPMSSNLAAKYPQIKKSFEASKNSASAGGNLGRK